MQLHVSAGLVYGDIVTRLDIDRAELYTDRLRRALTKAGVPGAYVTGPPAIQHDLNPILADDLRKGEIVALPIVLLVLVLVLGIRPVLVVPFVFAACTITATLAIVYGLAHVILMVSYVPNLVELIGIGLAVDYSLLIVQRFREEVDRSISVDDAIVSTMATAGRTVLFSGAAVAIGLALVLITPVPFIRSMGVAGVVVPAVSMLAALTLQPSLLSVLGRVGVRSFALPALGRVEDPGRGFWARLARTVMRRRLIVLAISVCTLAALSAPVAWLRLTPGSISAIPLTIQSARGLTILSNHVGLGAITPTEVVIDAGGGGRARTQATSAAVLRLGTNLLQDPEVFVVAIGPKAPYIDSSGRYARVIIVGRHAFGDEASQQFIDRLRRLYIPGAHFPAGLRVSTGGGPAQGVDFLARAYGSFPWLILLLMVLSYLVLLRAFRSVLLPLMALLLDVVSAAATYGMLVVIFRFGLGADLLGVYRTNQIEGWIPVFLFAMLFGLSMDYEVFLVSRMREARDCGEENAVAIAHGLERTGPIVTAAAVIMVVSFSGFIIGRVAGLQEFGAGLALGVLLDVTVVRLLLMPSLMALFGRWCWWLPSPLARLTGVEASALANRERRGLTETALPLPTSQR
jgi:RND superfamily putative drug exporter